MVDVTCFSDMPAAYKDDLISSVTGLAPVHVKTKVAVVGCPLKLAKTCVGLDLFSQPPKLDFSDLLTSSNAATRTLKVLNTGPVDCLLSWRLRATMANEPPVYDIEVSYVS